jgi:hypothetical protein
MKKSFDRRLRVHGICTGLLLSMGCSSPEPGRMISGQLMLSAYGSSLGQPLLIARPANGRSFAVPVASSGRFRIEVPVGARYQLLVASRLSSGQLKVVSRITWRTRLGRARSTFVAAGGLIQLGRVQPVSAARAKMRAVVTSASDDGQGQAGQWEDVDDDEMCQYGEIGESAGDTDNTDTQGDADPDDGTYGGNGEDGDGDTGNVCLVES